VKLLVDIGNTRLKWGCWDGARLHAGGSAARAENVDFAALFAEAPRPDALWVASVAAPALDTALARFS